ncbi:MAG TPA: hypothetical protein VNU21_15225 [Usitatibacter sp.]|nr:hypothetical protein [Usitatibacter sp.]
MEAALRICSHRRMLMLARFAFGRILLHLLAMAGDRCYRFHGAGIARELRRAFGWTARLRDLNARMLGAMADHLSRPLGVLPPGAASSRPTSPRA